MATYQVGYFVGSLSSTSINRLLAQALVKLAPPELALREIPIRDLPLYSPTMTPTIRRLRARSSRRSPMSMRSCSSRPSTTVRFPAA